MRTRSPAARRGRVGSIVAASVGALALTSCAGPVTVGSVSLRSTPLVDRSQKPPLVNSLAIDPRDGSFLLTTNRGFFRIRRDGSGYRRLHSSVSARDGTTAVGTFLTVFPLGGRALLGSGHPDNRHSKLPQFLGVLESADGGGTWRVVAREGVADLHVIRRAGSRIYAFDAVLGLMLASDDGGRNWDEHAAPRGQLMGDFVVDPGDRDYLLAATEDALYRSQDAGRTWRPLEPAQNARLAWAGRRLVRADRDGSVYESTDRGGTWTRIGDVGSEVWKLAAVGPRTIYAAIGDGSIRRTQDGGRTWTVVFTP